jgi:hypothetical protein
MMSEQVSALIRNELKLAQVEMTSKGKQAALGAGMFGASGVVAVYGSDVKAKAQAKAADVSGRAQAKTAELSGRARRSPLVQRRWPLAVAAGVVVAVFVAVGRYRKA